MFINEEYINGLIEEKNNVSKEDIQKVLDKATTKKGLSHEEVAILLNIEEDDQLQQLLEIAGRIKREIYGNRIVMFAPLYVSNYCVNNCRYCGYRRDNDFKRKKLTMDEVREEVRLLEQNGHKRLALELGEDPVNADIDYTIECIKTIYDTQKDNGSIRRINVNIAATTEEEYKMLKEAEIGTYILFQETYHKPTYNYMHPKSIKGDYEYHLHAFERAMRAGIDDVGGGVLFGLADYKFEVLSLMLHNEELEKLFTVGFHTISEPRLKKAEGMNMDDFPHLVDDKTFKKIVAVIRLAVPFTGIILSTRETKEMRNELIQYGVSQVSAGSCTDVGGYSEQAAGEQMVTQFNLEDKRPPKEVLETLILDGYIPSYCTACYRSGRTGDRFMRLAKSGQIHNVCTPNALMTLAEYMYDYGDDNLKRIGEDFIAKEVDKIDNLTVRTLITRNVEKIKNGERDLFV
jgi:2-iminoacetate synthase